MAPVSCMFGSLLHAPKTLIVTLGDVLESGNAKNRVNLARFFCARCGVLYILRVMYTYA